MVPAKCVMFAFSDRCFHCSLLGGWLRQGAVASGLRGNDWANRHGGWQGQAGGATGAGRVARLSTRVSTRPRDAALSEHRPACAGQPDHHGREPGKDLRVSLVPRSYDPNTPLPLDSAGTVTVPTASLPRARCSASSPRQRWRDLRVSGCLGAAGATGTGIIPRTASRRGALRYAG